MISCFFYITVCGIYPCQSLACFAFVFHFLYNDFFWLIGIGLEFFLMMILGGTHL